MVDITVTNPGAGSSDERALIDTGAALTVMPERLAKRLRLKSNTMVVITGVFGRKIRYKYTVDVAVGGAVFKPLEVIPAGGEALIGRNLINRWKMTLDGTNEVLEILP